MRQRVGQLRRGKPLPASIADPRMLAGMVNALLPVLPPYGTGRCYRRSLILLNLWSRCGLVPVVHLGVRPARHKPVEGHVWLTAPGIETARADTRITALTRIDVASTWPKSAPDSRPDQCRW